MRNSIKEFSVVRLRTTALEPERQESGRGRESFLGVGGLA